MGALCGLNNECFGGIGKREGQLVLASCQGLQKGLVYIFSVLPRCVCKHRLGAEIPMSNSNYALHHQGIIRSLCLCLTNPSPLQRKRLFHRSAHFIARSKSRGVSDALFSCFWIECSPQTAPPIMLLTSYSVDVTKPACFAYPFLKCSVILPSIKRRSRPPARSIGGRERGPGRSHGQNCRLPLFHTPAANLGPERFWSRLSNAGPGRGSCIYDRS